MVGPIYKRDKKGRVLPSGHIDGAYRTVATTVVHSVLVSYAVMEVTTGSTEAFGCT